MKIFSAVLLVDRATRAERSKLKATCDISHLFQGSETIYNVKCENDIGVSQTFKHGFFNHQDF